MNDDEVKISDLANYTDPKDNDILHIIDVENNVNKKITVSNLLKKATEIKKEIIIIEASSTISDNYEITLSNSYIVGDNSLEVYWNGVLLKKATDNEDGHYKEVGTAGSSSNKIQFYRTSDDGSYTLQEDAILTAIIRKIYEGSVENAITRGNKKL